MDRQQIQEQQAAHLLKCSACGWVHTVVPHSSTADNPAAWKRFETCFHCHDQKAQFLPAKPSDVPLGATLQPIVLK